MASISKEPNGRRTIQIVCADKKRRSIRLGKISQRAAEAVQSKIEHLVVASITGGAIDADTAAWVASLDAMLYDKLVAVRLLPKRIVPEQTAPATLQSFLAAYIAVRRDVKAATITTFIHASRNLTDYFGADKPLAEITPGDADEWSIWLRTEQGLAENTARRRCAIAKQFFRAAVRKRLVAENPFDDLVGHQKKNHERFYFVTMDEAAKVLEACPNAEWRLLFALSRFGGLRCPSESLSLRWKDVDWHKGRITITSPKTEHHEGHESRVIPLFPELRPHLEESFEQAAEGAEFVIVRYRDSGTNLRTMLGNIIRRAGLTPWPKPFQNLRSTRETELTEVYPVHVVCQWIGNSEVVAKKHYLQVTEAHFEQAIQPVQKAVQNPVQQPHEMPCNALQEETADSAKPLVFSGLQELAKHYKNDESNIRVAGGHETTRRMRQKNCFFHCLPHIKPPLKPGPRQARRHTAATACRETTAAGLFGDN